MRGYGKITNPGSPSNYAHRLSYVMHNGPIPLGMFVCHRCDVRHCVRPDHRFLGTNADNMADKARKSRARGGGGKITAEQAEDVKRRVAAGARQIDLARELGLSRAQVSRIISGKRWGAPLSYRNHIGNRCSPATFCRSGARLLDTPPGDG